MSQRFTRSMTKALALAQAELEKEYPKDLPLALLEMEHEEAPADMSTMQALDNAREIHEIKGSITAIFESLKSLTMAQASNRPILQPGPSSIEQPTRSSPNLQPTDDPDFGQYDQPAEEVKAVTEEMGIGFLGIGFQPKWGLKDIPIMPKGRYEIMRNYMPKVGSLGLDMIFRTCTVQVNLDFNSESDMIRKFRAGLALQPIATALFANSPFTEGKPNGYLSMRRFEQYVDYALDVPMYFVYRNKKYIACSGMSFRDFLAGKLPPIPGELPTLNDWENHLTTIFPEVRLKRYLEMRGADGGPWRRLCALPAIWVFGLFSLYMHTLGPGFSCSQFTGLVGIGIIKPEFFVNRTPKDRWGCICER
ncbi:hypothetical protein HHK36_018502 [Tetracentron sinense]|uniref:glutamate--cysteine ligase n=1 Tax=Tetracentron sinense TaxID=13715 RepID=A0A834YYX4_TETSI|nr:hypothetical protein HHK36_018502 [Tetracentron sinense]